MLWTPFAPMDPQPHRQAFDDPTFAFQVKWDGVRIIAHTDGQSVRLWNKRRHERTTQYPELVAAVRAAAGGESAILDGEVVAMGPQGPHFPSVLRRDWATAPATLAAAAKRIPVVYMVFDLVYRSGSPLLSVPFFERVERLHHLLRPTAAAPECVGAMQVVETFRDTGIALFAAVCGQGLEGIVAKRLAAPYRFGKSADWLKVKNFQHITCTIGGYAPARGGIASLRVGWLDADGVLRYAGRVGTGLSARSDAELLPRLLPLRSERCPFDPPLRVPVREGEVHWVSPQVAVRVEFLEWTDDVQLRHPKYLGLAPATAPSPG